MPHAGVSASLVLGDCLAYALAIRGQIPLLYKGDDFAKTDPRVANLGGSLKPGPQIQGPDLALRIMYIMLSIGNLDV